MALTKILAGGMSSGITMADQFRLTASLTSSGTLTNWERPTDANGNNMLFAQLSTGMTQSSGIFSFPSTGYYVVYVASELFATSGDGGVFLELKVTENNSSYVTASISSAEGSSSGDSRGNGSMMNLLNITDITNQKFKAEASSISSGSSILGDADYNRTAITVLKVADSQ